MAEAPFDWDTVTDSDKDSHDPERRSKYWLREVSIHHWDSEWLQGYVGDTVGQHERQRKLELQNALYVHHTWPAQLFGPSLRQNAITAARQRLRQWEESSGHPAPARHRPSHTWTERDILRTTVPSDFGVVCHMMCITSLVLASFRRQGGGSSSDEDDAGPAPSQRRRTGNANTESRRG